MARAADNLRSDAGYTRAIAVDLLEEISPSVLFGPQGDAVIRVIEAVIALDEEARGHSLPRVIRQPIGSTARHGTGGSLSCRKPCTTGIRTTRRPC